MAELEATGALEELLLRQRTLVDCTLYLLLEDAPLGDLLAHFQTTILELRSQEPSFWQLQVVQFIRNVLKMRVGDCVRDAAATTTSRDVQDPTQVVARIKTQVETSSELQEALSQLQRDVDKEGARLTQLLNADKENHLVEEDENLVKFWDKLQLVERTQLKDDEDREAEEFESCSFEMLSFDDDRNDVSRSAMSFPCMEDFPATILRMQSTDVSERAIGLAELMQMPTMEIIHSGPAFPAVCSAVVGLFLDTGVESDVAERAKRVIYDLLNQVEDAAQFLELYSAVLDFMGFHLETGELFVDRQSICENSDPHYIAVLDCFRVFYALINRVTQHWVYFSAEALAQLQLCTLRLLTMYSNSETEVETKHVNPFMMMSLVNRHPMEWFKLWLLNAPNTRQLFVAIHESGFIADLLQYLSRLRPLAPIKATSASDGIEKRIVQSTLIILSYTCEYQEGRDLVSQWRRLPAHAYIKRRRTTWERPVLETFPADNDSLYRVGRGLSCEEEQPGELEADYEHLGAGIVDALVLSAASIIATTPTHPREEDHGSDDEQWSISISKRIAAYFLHVSHVDEMLASFVQIVNNCWVDSSPRSYTSIELEQKNPWFPFRQSMGTAEVCNLVVDSISKRILSGALTRTMVRGSGQVLLYTVLSSDAVLKAEITSRNLETTKSLMELCKRLLQSPDFEVIPSREEKSQWCFQNEMYELIARITSLPQAFKIVNETGVVDELSELLRQDDGQELVCLDDHIVGLLGNSVAGVLYVNNSPLVTPYVESVCKQWSKSPTLTFHDMVGCLSFPMFSKAFFSRNEVQTTAPQVVAKLQESVDVSVALNSPYDECPTELMDLMCRVQLLQCCLSTQFASSALLSLEHSPLLQFIADTLSAHKLGVCMSSCHAEDTCCVAFQMALSLVSCVPALLECSGLFSEIKLLDLDGKRKPRDVLPDGIQYLGPCSLLEKQLRYEYEFIGGASEKLSRCELFEFDEYLRQTESNRPNQASISDFSFTLQQKILQAIKDGVASGSSVPMDFVLISQASWELISELEAEVTTNSSFMTKSAGTFTKIFADLIYNLVMSGRSRLEPLESSNVDKPDVNSTSTQRAETFYPSDTERKLMNRLYKNYASGVTLDASPTLLHCIVKKFGKVAIDCFPVSILMMLHPTYDEANILRFLSHCTRSASASFLWPKTVLQKCNGVDDNKMVIPATAIAAGVEVIMEREFPQMLQVIDQCHCSLLSLVLRWHGQNFWNYFDWENIVIYTYFNILYGAEFQVYIIVAVLKHLEPTMRELTAQHSSRSLAPFLSLIREPIRGFRFSPWRTLLHRLRIGVSLRRLTTKMLASKVKKL